MQALLQTIHLEMDEQKRKQLKAMLGICQRLGAETRYHPEHRYSQLWSGLDGILPVERERPLLSNRKFKEQPLNIRPSCAIASTHSAHWSIRFESSM